MDYKIIYEDLKTVLQDLKRNAKDHNADLLEAVVIFYENTLDMCYEAGYTNTLVRNELYQTEFEIDYELIVAMYIEYVRIIAVNLDNKIGKVGKNIISKLDMIKENLVFWEDINGGEYFE